MKQSNRELNIKLKISYPNEHGVEAKGILDDLEERILTWVKREVSAANDQNRNTKNHEEIHVTAILS